MKGCLQRFTFRKMVSITHFGITNLHQTLASITIYFCGMREKWKGENFGHILLIVIVNLYSASSGEAPQRCSRPNKTKPCSKRMVFRRLRKRGRDRARSSERRWLDCSCNQSVWLQEQSCCLLMFTRLTRYG